MLGAFFDSFSSAHQCHPNSTFTRCWRIRSTNSSSQRHCQRFEESRSPFHYPTPPPKLVVESRIHNAGINFRFLSTASITVATPSRRQTRINIRRNLASAPQISLSGTKSSSLSIKRCFSRLSWRLTIWTSNLSCRLSALLRLLRCHSPHLSHITVMLGAKQSRT
jgi:hypothetical protein